MAFESWNWRGDGAASKPAEGEKSSGIMVLTPPESKRLLAKAVVAMEPVRRALEKGRVIVANGTTTAFVAEEILGKPVPKELYVKGIITQGLLCGGRSSQSIEQYVFVDGVPVDREAEEVLKEFDGKDVFIKGANAVDPFGNVGSLVGNRTGGTVGECLGIVIARGSHLIVPVGLEKLIPSVPAAAPKCGLRRLKYPDGATVGFWPVVGATVVTEIQALRMLAGVEATHVASGGIGGSEGAVVLVVEGPDDRVRAAFELWESVKGEPPVPAPPTIKRYGIDGRSGA